MGWHYILNLECRILPEHIDFIRNEYLRKFNYDYQRYSPSFYRDYYHEYDSDNDSVKRESKAERLAIIADEKGEEEKGNIETTAIYKTFNKFYRDLIDIWLTLDLNHFYEYKLSDDGIFTCHIERKVNTYKGDLWQDYLTFVKDIIVPISSEITECVISSDDFGDRTQEYTDLELRGGRLELNKLIKQIEHKWEDGEIVETRIVYKRSIKKAQEIDLNRCFH